MAKGGLCWKVLLAGFRAVQQQLQPQFQSGCHSRCYLTASCLEHLGLRTLAAGRLPAGSGAADGQCSMELPSRGVTQQGRNRGAAPLHIPEELPPTCSHLAGAASCRIFPKQLSFGVDPGSCSGCGVACFSCWGSFASAGVSG